jgi:hypothetical protein
MRATLVVTRGPGLRLPRQGVAGHCLELILDASWSRHHDAFMRTTLTLDADVARLLKEEAHRQRKPFKQVVNDAIRRGLGPLAKAAPVRRYRVVPHVTALRPGIDPASFNALADELEDEGRIGRLGRS